MRGRSLSGFAYGVVGEELVWLEQRADAGAKRAEPVAHALLSGKGYWQSVAPAPPPPHTPQQQWSLPPPPPTDGTWGEPAARGAYSGDSSYARAPAWADSVPNGSAAQSEAYDEYAYGAYDENGTAYGEYGEGGAEEEDEAWDEEEDDTEGDEGDAPSTTTPPSAPSRMRRWFNWLRSGRVAVEPPSLPAGSTPTLGKLPPRPAAIAAASHQMLLRPVGRGSTLVARTPFGLGRVVEMRASDSICVVALDMGATGFFALENVGVVLPMLRGQQSLPTPRGAGAAMVRSGEADFPTWTGAGALPPPPRAPAAAEAAPRASGATPAKEEAERREAGRIEPPPAAMRDPLLAPAAEDGLRAPQGREGREV